MKLADGIQKHGFRKWYERELLQSHAHMTLTFLSGVGIVAAFEAFTRFRAWTDQLHNLLALLVCAAVGLWSLRRYLYLLNHAEAVANQAECSQCGTYGRLRLRSEAPGAGAGVAVRCARCEHEWRIDD
jgi:hypothetical protein